MSNFDFLRDCYPSLHQKMVKAESRVFTEPLSAAHYTRLALEEVVYIIYKEEQITMPYDTGLASLMREDAFREVIRPDFHEGYISAGRRVMPDLPMVLSEIGC